MDVPERGEFALLIRHFLDRFFNNEMTSSDGDGKTRLIQVACATGIPGFIVAMYLWPAYHDMLARHRPYWAQVSDHYLYVLYSLVVMGIVTIFEWDLFFPNLLDIFVLSTLPVKTRNLFLARIAAISILVVGFLFNANILATLALPAAIDPPSLARFLAAHLLAVTASGLFAAAFILALQGVLLAVFGAAFFRRISLFLQGLFITTLSMLLFSYPVLSGNLSMFVHSESDFVRCFPPFWFLGIYQRVMEGPTALPIYATLARIGCDATILAIGVAVLFYPFAYWRRTRQLIEDAGARHTRSIVAGMVNRILDATLLRIPERRAICHFIGQTLLRIQRYRIYLVMYCGLGAALVLASVLRLTVAQGRFGINISSDGVRAAIPIVAFWTIAGLRMALTSRADRRDSWVFRTIHGKAGMDHLLAARIWVFLWAVLITLGTVVVLHTIAPAELRGWWATIAQVLVAIGLCLLLTDILFLDVKTIPFTGKPASAETNLAIVLLKYISFFVPLVLLTATSEDWIEANTEHLAVAVLAVAAMHLGLRRIHRRIVNFHAGLPDLDEDEEEFPQRLGLRY